VAEGNDVIAVGPLLILLALLGAPLFAVIAASAMLGFLQEDIDLQAIAIEFYGIAEMPILLAIPLFTFAGYLLSESGAPRRLVRLTGALLGWMPAGLAIVSLATCAFFTAFTGASGVTIIALGALLFPPAAGRLSGEVQPRPDYLGRQPGTAVRAVIAADPVRHRGRNFRRGPVPGRRAARSFDAIDPVRLQRMEEPCRARSSG
jgi:hypothetical protein